MKIEKPAPKHKSVLVWAVDPFETEARPSAAAFQAVCRWAADMNCEIQPATVVSPSRADLERGLFGSVAHVQTALEAYLKKYPHVKKGQVLVNEGATQATAVAKLVQYAREAGAAGVVVSSHGRSGIDRMILGSFAEKVLEFSPWPVFFLPHRAEEKKEAQNVVLFPTDLSNTSWAAYRAFLKLAAGRNFKVVLLHVFAYPAALSAGMGVYLPDGYVEDQEQWALNQTQRWADEGKRQNVDVQPIVRAGGIGAVQKDMILDAAQEFGASTVVMNSKSVALGRVLLGSLAYPVFRANLFTTIMYGPQAQALAQQPESAPLARANG